MHNQRTYSCRNFIIYLGSQYKFRRCCFLRLRSLSFLGAARGLAEKRRCSWRSFELGAIHVACAPTRMGATSSWSSIAKTGKRVPQSQNVPLPWTVVFDVFTANFDSSDAFASGVSIAETYQRTNECKDVLIFRSCFPVNMKWLRADVT